MKGVRNYRVKNTTIYRSRLIEKDMHMVVQLHKLASGVEAGSGGYHQIKRVTSNIESMFVIVSPGRGLSKGSSMWEVARHEIHHIALCH